MRPKLIKQVMGVFFQREYLIDLAAGLTFREKIHGDVEKDPSRKTENNRVDDWLFGNRQYGSRDRREPNTRRGEEEYRYRSPIPPESTGRGIAGRAFV